MIDYAAVAGPVARHLLGEPNAQLSTVSELRFGAKGSVSIDLKKGTWYDWETGEGGGVLDLVRRELPAEDPANWLRQNGYVPQQTRSTTYDYRDEGGKVLFRERRVEDAETGKRVRSYFLGPDPDAPGEWRAGKGALDGVRRVLYRLPELAASPAGDAVYLVEGPKKVEVLRAWGLVAASAPGGAGKWRDEYSACLRGRHVVVVPDDDPPAVSKQTGEILRNRDGSPRRPGLDGARKVARAAARVAASVKVVELPGLPPKGDVVDFAAAGRTREEFLQICATVPPWEPPPPADGGDGRDDDERPLEFSDSTLALLLAEQRERDLRYVPAWGRWYTWDSSYWEQDTILAAFNAAHRVCRAAAKRCERESTARSIASNGTVVSVSNIARSDPRIVASPDAWDSDPWILATPGGVVDLRTGRLRPARPEDYATMRTAVTPSLAADDGERCPTWITFLRRVLGGDEDLVRYVQRACGYILTGNTVEQSMFFLYGLGQNGKSRFVEAISGVLGTYATTAPIETFIISHHDRHPAELAMLRGVRLVTAVETEEGRAWAESRIKMLTGGDRIAARFMRQDFFNFIPAFKLLVFGNHKPSLRTVDKAMKRRMNLWPFLVEIPETERDPYFGEKLRDEWPGILAWMIDGCLAWQRDRLNPPGAVVDATSAYLEQEDSFQQWFDDCCERSTVDATPTSWLFFSWKRWAERSGEYVGSQKRFAQRIESVGLRHTKITDTRRGIRDMRGFVGVKLTRQDEDQGASS